MPTCSAPSSAQQNSHDFLLCQRCHNRKSWLFADTPSGARASALYYTLIETAKANGIDPFKYILHLSKHIASIKTVNIVFNHPSYPTIQLYIDEYDSYFSRILERRNKQRQGFAEASPLEEGIATTLTWKDIDA